VAGMAPSPPSAPPAPPAPIAAPRVTTPRMPAPVLGEADLASSYLTLEQLIAERGLPLGTLEELVAGGTAMGVAPAAPAAPAAPVRPRAPSAAMPAVAAAPPHPEAVVPIASLAPAEGGVVPVEELLYRGERALRRALELKPDLLAALRAGDPRLHALVSEVTDLLELGVGAGP